MTEQAALLTAIAQQPECDTARLVYADWLDENGDPDRAEFIRGQCQVARWGCTFKQTPYQPGWNHNCGTDKRGYWLCQPIRMRRDTLLDRHRAEWSRLPCPNDICGGLCHVCNGATDLFRRVVHEDGRCRVKDRTVTFTRGFIESVSCTLEEVGREEVCPCRRHNGGTSTRVGSCQTCNDRGLVWRLSEWSKAVVKAAPVVKFVPTDVEAWQGVSGDWYAISPNIRRGPAGLEVWHEIHSNGGYHTKEAAESALPVALGRLVRAEVYGKAVPT